MNTKRPSWELIILLFAFFVTALTGIAYRIVITYNVTVPWFGWVVIVALCAFLSFWLGSRQQQPKR